MRAAFIAVTVLLAACAPREQVWRDYSGAQRQESQWRMDAATCEYEMGLAWTRAPRVFDACMRGKGWQQLD